jgi:hypothetical protein
MNEVSKANMGVYKKLSQARTMLRSTELKKSGHNKFAGYNYFELGDFLHPTLEIFDQLGLMGIVSFTKEEATLCIVDMDGGGEIVITSPFGSAALKGCHEVQNIGAVETYQRRYLWVTAMEIVEHDALDATTGKDNPKHRPATTNLVSDKRQSELADLALGMEDMFTNGTIEDVYYEYIKITDEEEKIALWSLLGSKVRSAIKKHGESLK